MKEIKFRAWHLKDGRMYFRAYQKWLHILLCEDDRGANGGRGKPAKRAFYGDCVLLESTGLFDKNNVEVFEGDVVVVRHDGREIRTAVGEVPDTFGRSAVHPLEAVLAENGIPASARVEIEVLGNEYESPEILKGATR